MLLGSVSKPDVVCVLYLDLRLCRRNARFAGHGLTLATRKYNDHSESDSMCPNLCFESKTGICRHRWRSASNPTSKQFPVSRARNHPAGIPKFWRCSGFTSKPFGFLHSLAPMAVKRVVAALRGIFRLAQCKCVTVGLISSRMMCDWLRVQLCLKGGCRRATSEQRP